MNLARLKDKMAFMLGTSEDGIDHDFPTRRSVTKKQYNFAKVKRNRVIARETRKARRKQAKKNNSLYSRKGKRK